MSYLFIPCKSLCWGAEFWAAPLPGAEGHRLRSCRKKAGEWSWWLSEELPGPSPPQNCCNLVEKLRGSDPEGCWGPCLAADALNAKEKRAEHCFIFVWQKQNRTFCFQPKHFHNFQGLCEGHCLATLKVGTSFMYLPFCLANYLGLSYLNEVMQTECTGNKVFEVIILYFNKNSWFDNHR